jgi:hypothetical protein
MGAHEPFRTSAASSLWNNIFDHANRPIVVRFYPAITAPGQQLDAPQPQRGSIRGTVTDVDDAVIPGATVAVDGPALSEHRALKTDETVSFEPKDLDPAVAYRITVGAKGFADWTSAGIVLTPGQALEMTDIKLKISVVETTVVALTVEQLADDEAEVRARF